MIFKRKPKPTLTTVAMNSYQAVGVETGQRENRMEFGLVYADLPGGVQAGRLKIALMSLDKFARENGVEEYLWYIYEVDGRRLYLRKNGVRKTDDPIV